MGLFGAIGRAFGKANQLAEEYQLARNYGTNWRDLVANAQNQLALQFAMLNEDRQEKFDERDFRREQRGYMAEERRLAKEARERAHREGLSKKYLDLGMGAVVVGPKGEVSLDRAALPTVEGLAPEEAASLEANILARARAAQGEHARTREERAADRAASFQDALRLAGANRGEGFSQWVKEQEWLRDHPQPPRPAQPMTGEDAVRIAAGMGLPGEPPTALDSRARKLLELGQSLGAPASEPPPDWTGHGVKLNGELVPFALLPAQAKAAAARLYRPAAPTPGLPGGLLLTGRPIVAR